MEEHAGESWTIEVAEVDTLFSTTEAAISFVNNLQTQASGQAFLFHDCGPVKGWKRFFRAKRIVQPCCAMEWDGPFASLIFFDDAWSEYRVVDEAHPVQPTDDQRRRIAHGELTPHPLEECMQQSRAFGLVREYLDTRTRPSCVKYRYVP